MTDLVPVASLPDTTPDATWGDKLFAALQYALPKHLLSRFIYSVMRCYMEIGRASCRERV